MIELSRGFLKWLAQDREDYLSVIDDCFKTQYKWLEIAETEEEDMIEESIYKLKE